MKLGKLITTESLAKLAMYQWNNYGTRIDMITRIEEEPTIYYKPGLEFGELEPVEEIDKIMRQKPKPKRVK